MKHADAMDERDPRRRLLLCPVRGPGSKASLCRPHPSCAPPGDPELTPRPGWGAPASRPCWCSTSFPLLPSWQAAHFRGWLSLTGQAPSFSWENTRQLPPLPQLARGHPSGPAIRHGSASSEQRSEAPEQHVLWGASGQSLSPHSATTQPEGPKADRF